MPVSAETPPPVISDAEKAAMDNYQCPDWFRDAKFDIWSHWGPQSVPGIFNGYAHGLYEQGSPDYQWHTDHYGHPSKFGYKDVLNSWKAEKFDPDEQNALETPEKLVPNETPLHPPAGSSTNSRPTP
jgi:hypothetical protein